MLPRCVARVYPISIAAVMVAVGTTTSGAAAKAATPAFIDITDCEQASGSGTGGGTIRNQGTEATAYELTIGFFDGAGRQLASASTRTGIAAAGAEVEWSVRAPGLGAVPSDDLTCRTLALQPVSGSTATPQPGSSDEEFPCDLLTVDEIARVAGNPLDGDATTSPVSEGDRSWTARVCTWTGPATGTSQEVTLAVSRSGDFPGGASACPPPIGTTTPVAGIGTEATWSWSDPGTTEKVGELRVCSPGVYLAVTVSGTPDEAQQQHVAKTVAEKALGAL